MVNGEMDSHEMMTENEAVAATDGTCHDNGAGLTVAPEELVPPCRSSGRSRSTDTHYLRINVAVGLLAFIAIVAALYLARAFLRALADRDTRELCAESGGGVDE